MKKLLLYSLFVMLSLCMTAQGTYTLTFNCVEQFGEAVQPEVITVTNVTRNWTETLNYPENTLSIYWDGIDETLDSAGFLSEAYPNPFSGSTNVTFSGSKGLIKARVINLNGDVLAEYNTVTNGGDYMITIDLAQPQMALLVVSTDYGQYVKKILSTGFGEHNSITMSETDAIQQKPTKKTRTAGDFCPGDLMSYRASFMDGVNCIVSETVEKQQFDSETITIPFTFTPPTVLTLDIYDVHRWTAKGTGSVISCGGQITCGDRGFCWDTEPHPTIELGSSHYSWCGQGPGEFTDCDLDFLAEGTLYYGRAYARNKYGVGYGEDIAFVTNQPGNGLPVVTTGDVTNITSGSAWCNNNHVTSTTELLEYGICWMKENLPSISGPHVAVGSGGLEATFDGKATGLEMTSTYYVCAYATNSAGTKYGSQKMFTTTDNTPYGGLPGRFTISENGDKACFSKGNLQYKASTNEWKFAEHQYDFIGEGNNNISSTYNGWIDLFGWGTSGNNHGAVCYQPWSTQYTNQFYWAYGEWQLSLNETGRRRGNISSEAASYRLPFGTSPMTPSSFMKEMMSSTMYCLL